MWSMLRGVREVRSRTDYIRVTDCRLLRNVAVQDKRHNTDHYLVLGCLHSATPAAHSQYFGERKFFPMKPSATPVGVNRLFAKIWGGHSQSTSAVMPWTGVDFTRNLANY